MTPADIVTVCALCGPTAAAVYAHHLAHGVSTQARIAADCGLSRRTVGAAVSELEAAGVVTALHGAIVGCADIALCAQKTARKRKKLPESEEFAHAQKTAQKRKKLPESEEFAHKAKNLRTSESDDADASHAHIHASTHTDAPALARRKRGDQPNAENCDENNQGSNNIQREPLGSMPTASADQGARVDLENAPAHEPAHTHTHEGDAGGSLPLPELSAPPVAQPQGKKRAEPKQPTCASEVMRIFQHRWRRDRGCAPTMTRGHVMQLQKLAREHDPRIAPMIVDGFEDDAFAAKAGHTFALLVTASVWDRAVSAAYNRCSFLIPMPDPATCETAELVAYQARFPERARMQIDSWRQDWLQDNGRGYDELPPAKVYAKMIRAAVKEGLAQGWF